MSEVTDKTSKTRVVVAGVEGSGTEWIARAILAHPDCEQAAHLSYPARWDESPYPQIIQQARASRMPMIVMMRDRTISQRSRIERFAYKKRHVRGWVQDREQVKSEMWSDLADWPAPITFVSYEGLIDNGFRYFTHVLHAIGLDHSRYPPDGFKPKDGNRKYIT